MTTVPGETAPVRIRQAERADLLAVIRIERASFPSPWPYEAFDGFLGNNGFLVAVDPDNADAEPVVGFLVADVVRTYGRTLGHVKNFAVHPDRRGDGIGSTLLSRALSILDGVDSVKLEVRESNDAARELYCRFGFEPLRQVPSYYDNGEDALVMIRES